MHDSGLHRAGQGAPDGEMGGWQIHGEPIMHHARHRCILRVAPRPGEGRRSGSMRKLLLIGIGAGDPDHVTMQAVKALNQVDVFFVMDKGPGPADLTILRREICERYIEHDRFRFVEVADPERDRTAEAYRSAVEAWREQRSAVCEQVIRQELGEGECGGFLIWGDPSLYDGTIEMVERIVVRGQLQLDYEVIPGISSVQALAARHRIALNRVGRSVEVTTGRLLTETYPGLSDDVVVMLDSKGAFESLPPGGVQIYWGAYLGTPDEILIAGDLAEVSDEIRAARRRAKNQKGWLMDTYLLRRRLGPGES
jgi:precorrin-6A synthase